MINKGREVAHTPESLMCGMTTSGHRHVPGVLCRWVPSVGVEANLGTKGEYIGLTYFFMRWFLHTEKTGVGCFPHYHCTNPSLKHCTSHLFYPLSILPVSKHTFPPLSPPPPFPSTPSLPFPFPLLVLLHTSSLSFSSFQASAATPSLFRPVSSSRMHCF